MSERNPLIEAMAEAINDLPEYWQNVSAADQALELIASLRDSGFEIRRAGQYGGVRSALGLDSNASHGDVMIAAIAATARTLGEGYARVAEKLQEQEIAGPKDDYDAWLEPLPAIEGDAE